ncbi:MAG TPA: NusG domain II-containing protein [Gallionellaceae bacterium]
MAIAQTRFGAHIRPGDWLALLGGALFTAWLTLSLWQGGAADKAVIRSGGKIFSEVPLSRDQVIAVPGPLGVSTVAIHNMQARIASDPSPRQYCVHQGWLSRAGEIAVCLPNQVSVELSGAQKKYDSLTY